MEGLVTSDGKPVEITPAEQGEQAFIEAMAAPEPNEPAHAAPPRREPKDPEAPYGRTKDGTPKRAPGGRPPKDAKPRVQQAVGPVKVNTQEPLDLTRPLTQMAQIAWTGLVLTGNKADAEAVQQHAPQIIPALNQLAQENARVAKLLQMGGEASAVGAVIVAVIPFAMQIAANHGVTALAGAPGISDPADLAAMSDQRVQAIQQQAQEV